MLMVLMTRQVSRCKTLTFERSRNDFDDKKKLQRDRSLRDVIARTERVETV